MRHLVPGLVASAVRATWLSNEPDGEASLSVYKPGDPAKLHRAFLLCPCPRHIVTVSPTCDETRSAGFSGFPAYSQMHTARLPVRGAAFYLRTVPSVTTRAQPPRAVGTFLADSHGRPWKRTISARPRSGGQARRIVSEDLRRRRRRPGHRI